MRTQSMKNEVLRLLRQAPFRPFVISLEKGDRVVIEHPENIALDPSSNGEGAGSKEFYVLSRDVRYFGTFDGVTSLALRDQAG